MSATKRFLLILPSTVLACALLGGFAAPYLGVASAASDSAEVSDNLKQFSKVLSMVEEKYADKVDTEQAIYEGAIPNMLRVLDPHSQFFDPESFKQLRDDQRGRYAGVGMQIGARPMGNSVVTVVIAPFPKTPAYKAGLRPGDVIAKVNGEAMDGLNTNEVAKRLRGPAGTSVKIGIERRGVDEMLEFEVTRAEIPRKSVPVAFHLKPDVGFIRVDSFNETTGRELEESLRDLDADKLQGLILDLRDNPGGLLSEGVYVSDKFLDKGLPIVSHHGRNSAERVYKSQRPDGGHGFPIVVIVNCRSASASEIVAGALQDHDRALIAGTNTFGKGLVQTVHQLGENNEAGIALTTARYYTPSGRLIQRRYDTVSLYEYYSDPCSEHYRPKNDEVKMTDGGRKVFGGGGITPDVKLEEPKVNDFQIELRRKFAFENYAQEFTQKHPDLQKGWEPDELTIEDFRQHLYREKVDFKEAQFTENLDFIKRFLKREIYVSAYDLDEAERVRFALDPEVQQALDLLPKAQALLDSAKAKQRKIAMR